PFVASVNARSGPDALATAMREMLRFDRATYRGAKSIEHAFGMLRDAVEATGVYVVLMGNLGHFRTNLSPRIFRGMALADPVAPFIVINETDSKSAWPFTLLHELGHILLGQSGISGYESGQMIERLCDDAAARFLLDRDELQALTDFNDNVEDMVAGIGVFANARKVSRKMVAYNMLKVGTIDATLYRRLAERFDEDRRDFPKKPTGGSGPDYYVVRRHRVGSGLVNLVNRMLAGGALTSTKAGKVLGVKPTAVGRMTERAG
ncbi:MAG: ImmA/IrrE family metallo-endopeptidase, partial [Oxalobacteraceae bacterium]